MFSTSVCTSAPVMSPTFLLLSVSVVVLPLVRDKDDNSSISTASKKCVRPSSSSSRLHRSFLENITLPCSVSYSRMFSRSFISSVPSTPDNSFFLSLLCVVLLILLLALHDLTFQLLSGAFEPSFLTRPLPPFFLSIISSRTFS